MLNEEPTFNSLGQIFTPSVSFEDLPAKQLFTLNINSPDSWMVQPRFADYDLDNIKMEMVVFIFLYLVFRSKKRLWQNLSL